MFSNVSLSYKKDNFLILRSFKPTNFISVEEIITVQLVSIENQSHKQINGIKSFRVLLSALVYKIYYLNE